MLRSLFYNYLLLLDLAALTTPRRRRALTTHKIVLARALLVYGHAKTKIKHDQVPKDATFGFGPSTDSPLSGSVDYVVGKCDDKGLPAATVAPDIPVAMTCNHRFLITISVAK